MLFFYEENMFDIEKKNDELTFLVEKVSFKRKALIALLGLSVVIGGVNGYNQNSEKISSNSAMIEKSNRAQNLGERIR